MSIDTLQDPTGRTGSELMREGILSFVRMGDYDVIGENDTQQLIGTSALTDCAGLGICDPAKQVGGVAHVSFQGADPDAWWERFGEYADLLMDLGHQNGGKRFQLALVNVASGYRRQSENSSLEAHATEWIQKRMRRKGDISEYEWHNASAFILNKVSGQVIT